MWWMEEEEELLVVLETQGRKRFVERALENMNDIVYGMAAKPRAEPDVLYFMRRMTRIRERVLNEGVGAREALVEVRALEARAKAQARDE